MTIPKELRYSNDHEWVDTQGATAKVGITDFAQDALGDVVYVDLPEVGVEVEAGVPFSEIESTKSVSELFAPVSGIISAVNEDLADAPEKINEDPYGDGWIVAIEMSNQEDVDSLLTDSTYGALIEGL